MLCLDLGRPGSKQMCECVCVSIYLFKTWCVLSVECTCVFLSAFTSHLPLMYLTGGYRRENHPLSFTAFYSWSLYACKLLHVLVWKMLRGRNSAFFGRIVWMKAQVYKIQCFSLNCCPINPVSILRDDSTHIFLKCCSLQNTDTNNYPESTLHGLLPHTCPSKVTWLNILLLFISANAKLSSDWRKQSLVLFVFICLKQHTAACTNAIDFSCKLTGNLHTHRVWVACVCVRSQLSLGLWLTDV